jgi:hypothetical protein
MISLPALHKHKSRLHGTAMWIDLILSKLDVIIGRDLIHEIGIDICFSAAEVRWDNASIPMQPVDKSTEACVTQKKLFHNIWLVQNERPDYTLCANRPKLPKKQM